LLKLSSVMFGRYRIARTPTTPVSHGFGSPSTPFPFSANRATPTPTQPTARRKRVHLEADKENGLPTLAPPAKKPYTPRRGSKEKLEIIFRVLAELNCHQRWFLGQIMLIHTRKSLVSEQNCWRNWYSFHGSGLG